MRKKTERRISRRAVRLETEMLAQRTVAEIAREAFIRGLTPTTLAELAHTSPGAVLAFMLDAPNARLGTIARFAAAMGLHYTMHPVPREKSKPASRSRP